MDATTRRVLASHACGATALSVPWPLLLVLVWNHTHSEMLLGVAAAARMAPYVALSWWVPRLADRHRRDRVVRVTLLARLLCLTGVALALVLTMPGWGVVLATTAVAVATPAYPTLAAAMPGLAGPRTRRATELLVTIEVASFVVGPAVGGLLLGVPWLIGPTAMVLALAGWLLYAGVSQPRPEREAALVGRRPQGEARALVTALGRLVAVNAVLAAAGIALLPLAESLWQVGLAGSSAYGVATAALGFGALGAPLLRGLGRTTAAAMRCGFVLMGSALVATAASPEVGFAVLPLLVVGAGAVRVEAAATTLLQAAVPDYRRAGVLGIGDSAMVSAAMVGALVAPVLAAWWGPGALLVVLALGCVALALRGVPTSPPEPVRSVSVGAAVREG
jgi:MFS family permease